MLISVECVVARYLKTIVYLNGSGNPVDRVLGTVMVCMPPVEMELRCLVHALQASVGHVKLSLCVHLYCHRNNT